MRATSVLLIAYIFVTILLSYSTFSQFYGNTTDFLEQGFAPAKSQNTVINIGNTKAAVGNEVFREGLNVELEDQRGQGCFVNGRAVPDVTKEICEIEIGGDWNVTALQVSTRAPLIVRITKFLLRFTIILAIPMLIYNGIRYVAAAGNENGTTTARNNILYVVGGLLLALLSLAIVTLVESLTFGSLPGVGG